MTSFRKDVFDNPSNLAEILNPGVPTAVVQSQYVHAFDVITVSVLVSVA